MPEFMFVDFEKKLVRATDESGHKEVSPIKNFEQTDTQMIVCHEGAQEDEVLRAAVLHKR